MNYKGFYINLTSEEIRREYLIKHLKENKLYNNYERFEALVPEDHTKLYGLKTKGEYGLWLSIIRLLENISKEHYQGFIHIIEDDFRFNNTLINKFNNLFTFQKEADEDIIFIDYLIDLPLLNLISLIIKQDGDLSKEINNKFSASYFYKGSTSSFLIRQSSAGFLSNLLKKTLNNLRIENRLEPIDMVLRSLFQKGILKGSICIPPLGCPDWDMDAFTSIQTCRLNSIKKSMRTHLLFRCAASGVKDLNYCAKEISKLFKSNLNIKDLNNLEDFYKFVENHRKYLNTNW